MADKLRFGCSCGKSLLADPSAAGKKAKCPACGQILTVPLSADPYGPLTAELAEPQEPVRRGPPPLPSQMPRRGGIGNGASPASESSGSIWDEIDDYRVAPAAEPVEAPASAPRQAAVGLSPLPQRPRTLRDKIRERIGSGGNVALRFGIAMLVGSGVAFWYTFNEMRLAGASSREPETISLKNLIDRGPDGNPNVILTDYQLCRNFVYQGQKSGGQLVGSWTKVWVPIVPREGVLAALFGAPAAAPAKVDALIFSTHVQNQTEMGKLATSRLRGMVTNRITSLGSEEKKFLQQAYPGINFDRCLIIDEGREPSSSGRIALFFGGSLALLLVGGVLVARRFI